MVTRAAKTQKLKEQQIIAEYMAISKKYNDLVLKGKLSKNPTTIAAITKRIEPVHAELLGILQNMNLHYPHLLNHDRITYNVDSK